MSAPVNESIIYGQPAKGVRVIAVCGRGSHINSAYLRHAFEIARDAGSADPSNYVLDLDRCESMDSTFMGTIAGMALQRRKQNLPDIVVTNISPHVRRLMETLGLKYLVQMRGAADPALETGPTEMSPVNAQALSKMERILMMIEAHERLVDIDSNNEVKFRGVLETLHESLEKERQRQQDPPQPTPEGG